MVQALWACILEYNKLQTELENAINKGYTSGIYNDGISEHEYKVVYKTFLHRTQGRKGKIS